MLISLMISFLSGICAALNIIKGIAYVLIIYVRPRSVRFLQFQRLIDFFYRLADTLEIRSS